MVRNKTNLILWPGGYQTPSSRFRIRQFFFHFTQLFPETKVITTFPDREGNFPEGWLFMNSISPRFKQFLRLVTALLAVLKIKKGDIVIMNRDFVPDKIIWYEAILKKRGVKLILDFDDAIFLGKRKAKFDRILPLMDYVVAGNEYLFNYAKSINSNTFIIPTVVDTNLYGLRKDTVKRKKKLTIGWSGSSGTRKANLPILKNAIEELSKDFDFTFLVIADQDPQLDWKVKDIKFIKWSEKNEVKSIQCIDIGVMPLNNTEFEKGKCGFKAIQYMAVGSPAIVSPVGVNTDIVAHAVNGFHAKDHKDWVKYISKLLVDHRLRDEMGKRAREDVVRKYSVEFAFSKWKEILKDF